MNIDKKLHSLRKLMLKHKFDIYLIPFSFHCSNSSFLGNLSLKSATPAQETNLLIKGLFIVDKHAIAPPRLCPPHRFSPRQPRRRPRSISEGNGHARVDRSVLYDHGDGHDGARRAQSPAREPQPSSPVAGVLLVFEIR